MGPFTQIGAAAGNPAQRPNRLMTAQLVLASSGLPGNPGVRRMVALCVAAWLVAATIACGTPERPTMGPGSEAASTLTLFHGEGEPGIPAQYFSPEKFLLYETLVAFDDNGDYTPRLARTWEHSDDYREWTYHLRDDVRWHDGTPFTSRDVKFTVELFSQPMVGYFADLEEVRTPDEHTVIIRTTQVRQPDAFTVYYPEHLLRDLDPEELWDWDHWRRPIGNGPYRFVRSVPHTVWVLEANDDYFRGRPAIDRVRLKLGGGNAVVELLAGNVDAATVDRGLLPEVESDPRFNVYHQIPFRVGSFSAIWWQHRHPLLASAALRRALTHAINRRELQRLLNLPEFLPLSDVPYTPRQLLRGELPEPLAYDPEAAIRILEQEGWHDTDGDGVRERNGIEAHLTALTPGESASGYGYAAVYVQAALRRVGVRMEIRVLPDPPRQEVHAGNFEVAFDPFNPFWATWQSQLGYANERPQRLLTQAAGATGDLDEIDALFRQTWADFARDIPLTLLAQSVSATVVHRRVRGLSTPLRADPFSLAGELWIEEETGR